MFKSQYIFHALVAVAVLANIPGQDYSTEAAGINRYVYEQAPLQSSSVVHEAAMPDCWQTHRDRIHRGLRERTVQWELGGAGPDHGGSL